MPEITSKMPEAGMGKAYARKFNELLSYVRTLRPIATINEEVEHTVHGTVRRPTGGGLGTESSVPRWL